MRKVFKDTAKLIFYSLYNTFEQKTLVYLKATLAALFKIRRIKRQPAGKAIIANLRLTYRLAFIYFK